MPRTVRLSMTSVPRSSRSPIRTRKSPVWVKAVPVIVTRVPPASGPWGGATDLMETSPASGSKYVNPPGRTPSPKPCATLTSTRPGRAAGGVVASMRAPASSTLADVACPSPKNTATSGASANPRPAMATGVPPLTGPRAGVTDATVGAPT